MSPLTVELTALLPLLLLPLPFMPQPILHQLDHLSIEIMEPVILVPKASAFRVLQLTLFPVMILFFLSFLQNWLSATRSLKQFTQYLASMTLHIFFYVLYPFLKYGYSLKFNFQPFSHYPFVPYLVSPLSWIQVPAFSQGSQIYILSLDEKSASFFLKGRLVNILSLWTVGSVACHNSTVPT